MATDRDVYRTYCASVIPVLMNKGYMKYDHDWDVQCRGSEIKYTFRIYDEAHDNQLGNVIIIYKSKAEQIVIIEEDKCPEGWGYDFSKDRRTVEGFHQTFLRFIDEIVLKRK